ncbi:MAG: acireductone synthase [Candidatus Melainabacteria bacterium]|nr:acireductone synthase [Candidatus Melainabacteria bacterium]
MIGALFATLVHISNPVNAIVTDIEGTTTSISFVHDNLFPYAKQHVTAYVLGHQNEPNVKAILQDVQNVANVSAEDVIPTLKLWMEQDKKITPLKALQGLMWEEGYRQGAFQGHVYDDAYEQMAHWKNQGIPLYVYSSGSVLAQKLLFSYSDHGDMTPLFSDHFDTKIGGKRETASYEKIAQQIGLAPERILFLSDTVEELNAAQQAGMQTVLLFRDGTPSQDYGHPCVTNFNEITLP